MASSKKKRQKIRPLRTVAYYATWLVPWRTFIRVRALRSGLTFRSHRRGVITRYIAKYGEHEPELTGWFSRYLSTCRRGLFVDVGANIGWHALHAATLAGVDTVVAFEADPVNAWLLERNRTDNNIANVVIKAVAVGDRRGTAQLHRYKDSNTARHSLATDHGMGSITVPLIDLDGALDDLGMSDRPIAALKVDVEGFEPAVIAGAQRALARTQAVVIELSPLLYREAGLSIDNLLRTLRTSGFTPFTVQPDGSLQADVTEWTDQNVVCELVWLRATPAHGAQSRTA